MAISLHTAMQTRRDAALDYRLGEREEQMQLDFTGVIGAFPSENSVKVYFLTAFLADPGTARDSQLTAPMVRFGFHIENCPDGTIPYARVSQWIYDDDLNYKGAELVVGAHCPAYELSGATSSTPFDGTVHISFQGYGSRRDPETTGDEIGGAY